MGVSSKSAAANSLPSVRARPSRNPWPVVAILAFLYGVSLIDRIILALIAEPLRLELGISGSQYGLLFGISFVLVYSISGIGAAYIADRGDRRKLLAAGVCIWSATTFATGFADSFGILLVLRGGVAIGESVLTPIAVSMIADLFPRERRTLPTSVYMMSGTVVGAGALIFGAGAVALAEMAEPAINMATWRLTMMVVAMPGFLGALAFLVLTHEPARRLEDRATAEPNFRDLLAHIASHLRLYAGMFIGVAFMATSAYGLIAWGPTLLVRDFGVPIAKSGLFYGAASALGGATGIMLAPPLVRYLSRKREATGLVWAAVAAVFFSMPLAGFAISSGNFFFTLFGIAVCAAGMGLGAVLPLNLIQLVTPARMQARMTAIYLLLFGLAGQASGPLLVNALAGHLFDGGHGALAHAIGSTSAIAAVAALGMLAVALRRQRRLVST